MEQKDKELLLKDLCARLPYRIKALNKEEIITIRAYIPDLVIDEFGISHAVEDCKPYLFPLSSMTEEQKREFDISMDMGYAAAYNTEINCANRMIDFFNKNHYDYRGLIPKGLALDATGLNIY